MKRVLNKKVDTFLKVLLFLQLGFMASLDDFELSIGSIVFILLWLVLLGLNANIVNKYGRK